MTTGFDVDFGKILFVDLQFQRVAEIFEATTAILNNQSGEPSLRPDSLMSPNQLDRANGGLYGIKGFGGLSFGYRKDPLGTDGLLQQLRNIILHHGTAAGERIESIGAKLYFRRAIAARQVIYGFQEFSNARVISTRSGVGFDVVNYIVCGRAWAEHGRHPNLSQRFSVRFGNDAS